MADELDVPNVFSPEALMQGAIQPKAPVANLSGGIMPPPNFTTPSGIITSILMLLGGIAPSKKFMTRPIRPRIEDYRLTPNTSYTDPRTGNTYNNVHRYVAPESGNRLIPGRSDLSQNANTRYGHIADVAAEREILNAQHNAIKLRISQVKEKIDSGQKLSKQEADELIAQINNDYTRYQSIANRLKELEGIEIEATSTGHQPHSGITQRSFSPVMNENFGYYGGRNRYISGSHFEQSGRSPTRGQPNEISDMVYNHHNQSSSVTPGQVDELMRRLGYQQTRVSDARSGASRYFSYTDFNNPNLPFTFRTPRGVAQFPAYNRFNFRFSNHPATRYITDPNAPPRIRRGDLGNTYDISPGTPFQSIQDIEQHLMPRIGATPPPMPQSRPIISPEQLDFLNELLGR